MKRKLCLISIICTLLVIGYELIQNHNETQVDTKQNIKNEVYAQTKEIKKENSSDKTLMMQKNSPIYGEIQPDIFVKYQDKEIKQVCTNMATYNPTRYLEGEQSIVVEDLENNLIKYHKSGNQEVIATNLASGTGVTSYKLSKDNKSIAYITQNGEFCVKRGNKEPIIIYTSIDEYGFEYKISDNGDYVYYIDNDKHLYLYHNGKSVSVSYEVDSFQISPDGKSVVFSMNESDVYKKTPIDRNICQISDKGIDIWSVKIYEDNSTSFIDDLDNLCVYDRLGRTELDLNVVQYIKKGDDYYYRKSDGSIYLMKGGSRSKVLGKEPKKINKKSSKGNFYLGNKDELIYLSEEDELFVDEKMIASNVNDYVVNSRVVAYVSSNKVYLYDLIDKKQSLEIQNADEYSTISLGNEVFFIGPSQ